MRVVNKVDPINLLRVTAALMVFFLHSTLFEDTSFFGDDLTFIMRTPAWGGVWIFIILSGYLIGSGYAKKRYQLDVGGICSFYWKRIKKVIIPTFIFIFICCTLSFPDFLYNNPIAITRFLNFSYRGDPGVDGVGACWYVFCIAWLWLMTPIVALIIDKLNISKNVSILFAIFLVLTVGFFGIRNYFLIDANWYWKVYTDPKINIDLYFGGFIFAYIVENIDDRFLNLGKYKNIFRIISNVVLVVAILINCYINNKMWLYGEDVRWYHIYGWMFETVYLVVCCFYFWANFQKDTIYEKVHINTLKKNPFRIIDLFAEISFEFYLFHSLILNRISPYVPLENGTLKHHFLLVFMTFVISLLFAYGFHKVFLKGTVQNSVSQK